MKQKEFFSSPWGLIMTTLGVAIGTGNIWRFPRIVAQNGGGTFLIPFFVFLFTWSIPIMVVEFSLGRKTRSGIIKSIQELIGPEYGWLGGFIGFCTMMIMFYYSVIMGWCLKYLWFSILGGKPSHDYSIYWQNFLYSGYEPAFFHFLAMAIGTSIVYFGISKGIERANKVFIPSLFVFLLITSLRAITLPGAETGLKFFFIPRWEQLLDHQVWLEAITQSAWSTGAGWGLFLTYSVYMLPKENVLKSSFLTGIGDGIASLLSGMTVIITAFAFLEHHQAMEVMASSSMGLTFIWIPRLFDQMVAGGFFQTIFFLTLCFAAVSSLISMIELVVRVMMDYGLNRKKAVFITGSGGFICGIPSALNINFLKNQDWVWGLGLLLNGFLFTMVVWKFGVSRFRFKITNIPKLKGKNWSWFEFFFLFIIPLEFVFMMGWWFWKAAMIYEPHTWWNPFGINSIGTCLFQWGLVLIILIGINRYYLRKKTIET